MSRSTPTLTNPARHFFEWAGSKGELAYWDKEKSTRVPIKLPFEFLVLDELATITGYDKQAQSGFWSNEVRSVRKEEFTVRNKNGVRYQGPYKDYERDIVLMPKGASYAQSVYIAYKEQGEWVIGNIKMSGSARSAWFDFSKAHKVQNGKVIMTRGDQQEAQTGPFFPPVFTYTNASPEEDTQAITLDKTLQVYLGQYLTAKPEDDDAVPTGEIDPDLGKATPEQLADFEARKAKAGMDKPLQPKDFPDDDAQQTYNRQAIDEVFFDEPLPEVPPEFR